MSYEDGNAIDMGATKPSNPKDLIGSRKMDLGLVPYTLIVCAARALLEGALKYGRFNWRMAGVRASIYHAAMLRHVAKWWNGQNHDKATRIHHLDNAIACLAIIRDAELYGKLTDDRPPCPDPDAMARLIDGEEETVAHLKELFKEHSPKQFTIMDSVVRNVEEVSRIPYIHRDSDELLGLRPRCPACMFNEHVEPSNIPGHLWMCETGHAKYYFSEGYKS